MDRQRYQPTYIAATFGYPVQFVGIPNFETREEALAAVEAIEHPGPVKGMVARRYSARRGIIQVWFVLYGTAVYRAFLHNHMPWEHEWGKWEKEHTTEEDMEWRRRLMESWGHSKE